MRSLLSLSLSRRSPREMPQVSSGQRLQVSSSPRRRLHRHCPPPPPLSCRSSARLPLVGCALSSSALAPRRRPLTAAARQKLPPWRSDERCPSSFAEEGWGSKTKRADTQVPARRLPSSASPSIPPPSVYTNQPALVDADALHLPGRVHRRAIIHSCATTPTTTTALATPSMSSRRRRMRLTHQPSPHESSPPPCCSSAPPPGRRCLPPIPSSLTLPRRLEAPPPDWEQSSPLCRSKSSPSAARCPPRPPSTSPDRQCESDDDDDDHDEGDGGMGGEREGTLGGL